MSSRFGPLDAVVHPCASPTGTAVLLHGLGFGPWLWEPWIAHFQARKLSVVALALPGHGPAGGDAGLGRAVTDVEAALATIDGPITLVGHSAGALVAQIVAARRPLQALALVCPLPPGQIGHLPSPILVRHLPGVLRQLPTGAPIRVSRGAFAHVLSAEVADAIVDRCVPWPPSLVRDLLLRRPDIDPAAVTAPTLVAIGRRDPLIHWTRARLLGDLYEAIVWRYDDLGHMPMWEPGGDRMGRDLAGWCAEPRRPEVLESEGFGPAEGIGHLLRRRRRGAEAKRRSAYGQKKSARG